MATATLGFAIGAQIQFFDGRSFTFTYQRMTEATGAGFTDRVELGTDLVNWETAVDGAAYAGGNVSIVVAPLDADTEEVLVTIPANGADKLFARLVVVNRLLTSGGASQTIRK